MTKKATLTVIQPDGSTKVTEHDPKDRPVYEVLRDLVGGLIQPCASFMEGNVEAYCNEEFLLYGMAPNPVGSKAVNWPVGEIDFLRGEPVGLLHGPIVILKDFDEEED